MLKNVFTPQRMSLIMFFLIALCFAADGADRIWPDDNSVKLVIDADIGRFPAYTKGSLLTVNYSARFTQVVNYNLVYARQLNFYEHFDSQDLMLPIVEGKRKINDDLNLVSFKLFGNDYVRTQVNTSLPLIRNFMPPSTMGKVTISKEYQGSVTLELRRDVIGGAVITPVDIPLLYTVSGGVTTPGQWPLNFDYSIIFSKIYLKTSGFIPVPVLCRINVSGGEHIDFGNIVTDSLTPARENENRQIIALDYRCNVKKTLPVEVSLQAQSASFSDAVIASTNPAVGIALSRNSVPLRPGGKFSSRLLDGQGHDTLTAVVTRNPAVAPGALETGPFSANAILILQQQ